MNKIFDESNVALLNVYNGKNNFIKETWYASRKWNGYRCITVIRNGEIRFYSRYGNEFFTLDNLKPALQEMISLDSSMNNIVLDSEVVIMIDHNFESFFEVKRQIHKKNHTIKNPILKVFDVLSIDEFLYKKQSKIFSERPVVSTHKNIHHVPQIKIRNKNQLHIMFNLVKQHGCEGLCLRKNIPCESGRTHNFLKLKEWPK
jgi:DNA ligase 1